MTSQKGGRATPASRPTAARSARKPSPKNAAARSAPGAAKADTEPKGPRPMALWNEPRVTPEEVVWWSKADKRYQIEVQRLAADVGEFCIFDHDNDDVLLANRPVSLAYGAVFGPDVEDIGLWQGLALHFIDNGVLPTEEK